MAPRTGLGFLLAALIGILVGRFLVPALDFWGVAIGVLVTLGVDVYLRNRTWRRQQREAAEAEGEPEPGPARTREQHRPQSAPRQAEGDGAGRHRRRRRRR